MRCGRSFTALSIALAASAAFAQSAVTLDATSGTGTISTNYTTTGGLTLNLGFFADYLVVGGGGGGGGATSSLRGAGGGGAGGVVTGTSNLSAINYSVLVGAGGAGGANSATNALRQGLSGTNSAFGSFTATGGGGGGAGGNDSQFVGSAGGSGGGAGGGGNSSVSGTTGGSGTTGQGTSGGASVNNTATNPNGASSNRWAGGGGGGAGSAGSNGDQAPGNSGNATGGSGGAGTASSISGSSVIYAGGGGGGAVATATLGTPTNTAGTGGAGGGGNGGSGNSGSSGANGVNGLGGGGGGAASSGTGGNGGSGLVIVRYQGASLGNIGGTVTAGSGSAAGYTIHTFTTTGSANFDMSGVNLGSRLATTLTGTLSGSGGLTFGGPGQLTLSASNSFTGDTRIASGTLAIANADALRGSTLDMNAGDSGAITFAQNSTLGGLTGSRNLANGGNTLTVGANHASTTYSGVLAGTGGLIKTGSGTLTLSGSNSYSGGTTLSGGTLVGTASSLQGDIATTAGTGVTFDGDELGFSDRYSGNLSGGGTLTKTGAGYLILTGSNSFTGGTTISGGAIFGTFLSIQGDILTSASTGVLFAGDTSGTYSGDLSGAGVLILGLGPDDTGTLTLTGSNSYSGGTAISYGRLALGNLNALGDSGTITFGSGTLQFTESNTADYSSRFSTDPGQKYAIDTNGQNVTLASALTSAGGSLTKSGAGTLTLSGSNTYSGGTTLSSGTLVGTSSSLQGNIAAAAGTGVTFDQDTSGTYAGILSGSGSLSKSGAGALTLTGSNTYSGGTTISSGTLQIGGAGVLGTSGTYTGTITNDGAIVFASSANQTITTAISGSGSITKSGAGALRLSGVSGILTMDRQLTVTTGSFFAGTFGNNSLYVGHSGTGTLNVSGGSVTDTNGYLGYSAGSVGTATVTSGTWANSNVVSVGLSGTGTLHVSGGSVTSYYGSIGEGAGSVGTATVTSGTWISATFVVGQFGSGTLNVSGGSVTNSLGYIGNNAGGVGTATVTSGTWATGGPLTVGGAGTGTLNVNGGRVTNTNATIGSLAGSVGTATVTSGTWANSGYIIIGGDGTGTLNVAGGSVTNSVGYIGNNAGSVGTATVTSGTWANSLHVYVGRAGTGTLNVSGGSVMNRTGYIGDGAGSVGTVTVTGGTWANSVSLSVGGSGAGTLNISGGSVTNTNGLLGLSLGSVGTVTVTSGTWTNSGSLSVGGSGTGTLNISGGSVTNTNGLLGLSLGSVGTVTVTSGTWANSGSLSVGNLGTGTLTMNGGRVIVGETLSKGSYGTIDLNAGGTLQIGTGGITGALSTDLVNNGTLIFNRSSNSTYNYAMSGSGSLAKQGAGTLTLTGSNTFTGLTSVSDGRLALGSGGGTGSIAGDIANSAVVVFNRSNAVTYAGAISGSGSLTKDGTGTLTLTGNNAFTGPTSVARGTLSVGDGGTSGSLTGGVALSSSALVFNRSDASTYGGSITGNGTLTKLGIGALTLTGNNSFKGDTTVSAGTLVLGSGNALSTTAAVTVASGATLQATAPIRIGYIDSQGTVVGGENLSATLTVTRSGNIGGIANGSDSQGTFAAGVVKLGTGTSTVNAPNTYTGLTWVRAGTLAVGTANAFAAASDLTVDSGATFDRGGFSQTVDNAVIEGVVGNSAIGGLLTVTGTLSGSGVVNGATLVNGVHAPGSSPGIQTFNDDLSYGSAAVINWELADNTASNSPVVFDQIVLTGVANLAFNGANVLALSFNGAGSLVDWNDAFWDVNRAWTVFDLAAGVTTGFGSLSLGGSVLDSNGLALDGSTRGSFSLGQSGQDVVLQFTAVVPEPSTYCMALAGLACGGFSMWRRRQRA